jgi:CRISPR-associated protein Csb2
MSRGSSAGGFLGELHVWCPYGFTQAEVEILLRIQRLNWGSGKYPVRPVLTALSKEPPSDAPFATGRATSKIWRSASPFVPPRYFYRSERGKVTLKEKDRPERQLIECLKAVGVATGGHVWRQARQNGILSRLESMPPQPLWDVIRAPGEDKDTLKHAVNVAVHQNGGSGGQRKERRVGLFFQIEFDAPVSLPVPALGHSCHFGLGLFVPAREGQQ